MTRRGERVWIEYRGATEEQIPRKINRLSNICADKLRCETKRATKASALMSMVQNDGFEATGAVYILQMVCIGWGRKISAVTSLWY